MQDNLGTRDGQRPDVGQRLYASIIVATRNRSASLIDACEAILAMDYPAERWELLIVDNLSTDDTFEVARSIADRHGERVRVLQERRLGLSSARNAGIAQARGEILGFIDDDAFPEAGWMHGIEEALGMDGVLAAGGPVDPLFQGDLPPWLSERYLPYLTVWDRGPEIAELAYNEYPRGANMAFRREVFERFGDFSHRLGRKGKSLLSGEETELCLRIERGGGKILYTPKSRVGHRVNAGRITESWLLDRFAAQGASEAIIDWRHGGFAGLSKGWKRFRRYADEAQQETGEGSDLYRRCQERSFRAYTRRALRCPWTVGRCRSSNQGDPLDPWLPFD